MSAARSRRRINRTRTPESAGKPDAVALAQALPLASDLELVKLASATAAPLLDVDDPALKSFALLLSELASRVERSIPRVIEGPAWLGVCPVCDGKIDRNHPEAHKCQGWPA